MTNLHDDSKRFLEIINFLEAAARDGQYKAQLWSCKFDVLRNSRVKTFLTEKLEGLGFAVAALGTDSDIGIEVSW